MNFLAVCFRTKISCEHDFCHGCLTPNIDLRFLISGGGGGGHTRELNLASTSLQAVSANEIISLLADI